MNQRGLQLIAAFGLLTRLPVWRITSQSPTDFNRSIWAFPIVGGVVGAIAGLAYLAAHRLGLPILLAAIWTLAIQLWLTGALHEDGLADTADGFGGGHTPERKLDIMRDSRIGSYGALALILALAIRATAIATIAAPWPVLLSLTLAGTGARAAILIVLQATGAARPDGMAAGLGRSPWPEAITGLGVAVVLGACILPLPRLLLLATVTTAIALAMAGIARRQIGGHTGDVLGATAALTECVTLSLLTL